MVEKLITFTKKRWKLKSTYNKNQMLILNCFLLKALHLELTVSLLKRNLSLH